MRTRKAVVGLFAAVFLMVSVPAGALSPNLITRVFSGYYPLGLQIASKYFECYLGGTREQVLAQLVYGSENYNLHIDASAVYYNPIRENRGSLSGTTNG